MVLIRTFFSLLLVFTMMITDAYASVISTQLIHSAQIMNIANTIAKNSLLNSDKEIVSVSNILDQNVPLGTVLIQSTTKPFITPTYLGIPIDIRINDKIVKSFMVSYRVVSYVKTAVLTRDLPSGSVIDNTDIILKRVISNGRLPVSTELLVGRKILSPIAQNTPIYLEQTVSNIVVKAGQPAILTIHNGAISLSADVIARMGGAVGDQITVFNPQTQKSLSGIVTGPNHVELNLVDGAS